MHGKDEKRIQTSGWKTRSEEATGADEVILLKWVVKRLGWREWAR
jgi:hypothetical protein